MLEKQFFKIIWSYKGICTLTNLNNGYEQNLNIDITLNMNIKTDSRKS